MGIENEFRLLAHPRAFRAVLPIASRVRLIEQTYIGYGTRVRRVSDDVMVEHWFTFKKATADGLVEIETAIPARDHDLLRATSRRSVSKRRADVRVGNALWEVDLFAHHSDGDFVIAEIELPEGVGEPDTIPDFLKPYVIRRVNTPEFSNEALSEPERYLEIARMLNAVNHFR